MLAFVRLTDMIEVVRYHCLVSIGQYSGQVLNACMVAVSVDLGLINPF